MEAKSNRISFGHQRHGGVRLKSQLSSSTLKYGENRNEKAAGINREEAGANTRPGENNRSKQQRTDEGRGGTAQGEEKARPRFTVGWHLFVVF